MSPADFVSINTIGRMEQHGNSPSSQALEKEA